MFCFETFSTTLHLSKYCSSLEFKSLTILFTNSAKSSSVDASFAALG